MFRRILFYHIFPILMAAGAVTLLLIFLPLPKSTKTVALEIQGKQQKTKGLYANLLSGNQAEIDLFASLQREDQITLFGSSEFTESPYAPYHFLPDSLGIPALGIGHAFHQSFSMYCALLSAREHLHESKICIILSPGWFETEGTNIEAFLEFVRPNFLNKIWHDQTISEVHKEYIGAYLDKQYDLINSPSHSINKLRDLYLLHSSQFPGRGEAMIRKKLLANTFIPAPNYAVELVQETRKQRASNEFDYDTRLKKLQQDFNASVTNNQLYVSNTYFSEFIQQQGGKMKKGHVDKIDPAKSVEMSDLMMLLKLLREQRADASFVIQPLNPYHYENLSVNRPLIHEMQKAIESIGFPCLNLYVDQKSQYDAGTLNDIMHLGDYGWLKVNRFLQKTYHE
ncbi:MAG: hypothetical protein EP338_12275 [Bacteroidetes bacterium]|nr:MAG: hypothetical protein EP338_12275 [Bacteroidota bacterium]